MPMLLFRALLLAITLAIVVYTGVVIARHGADFATVFFGDIARVGWPGQFNLDFLGLLLLAALWVAWRHRFGAAGLGLGLVTLLGGTPVIGLYLLVLSLRHGADVHTLLLGERAAGAPRRR